MRKKDTLKIGLAILLLPALAACAPAGSTPEAVTAAPTSALTSPSIPEVTVTPIPTTEPPPLEHRIQVRVIAGDGEFYDTLTGEKFVPRGNNYIRIEDQNNLSGEFQRYHSTFNTGSYDREQARIALQQMNAEGYNVVRVFINHCCSGGIGGTGQGLSPGYMDNLTDFLILAKENDLFVFFAQDWLPPTAPYSSLINSACCDEFNFINTNYLPKQGVQANAIFFQNFIQELIARGAPLDYIFAYGLRNEFYYDSDQPPLSLTSGLITTANGSTYDMSLQEDKQRMMDEGLVYFIDEVRSAILEVDATALVTIGFFWPQEPNPARIGDQRVINTLPALASSSADFIDLHVYPGAELTLPQYVENYGMAALEAKPIVMGEFGAFTPSYSSAAQAATALHNWQVASCEYGFDGWLLGTWDTWEQTDLYNGLSDDGLINQALSPANRPDPCLPAEGYEGNVALSQPASASRIQAGNLPAMAVDGLANTWWSAGAIAPQWIEINLGAPTNIFEIRLLTSQSPNGATVHRIRALTADGNWITLTEFSGNTNDSEWLIYIPEEPLDDVQFIRVETISSPSWVGWREIEIIGTN